MNRTIDPGPLTEPITTAQIAAYRAAVRARMTTSSAPQVVALAVVLVVMGMFGVIAIGLTGSVILAVLEKGSGELTAFVVVPMLASGFVVAGAIVIGRRSARKRWERHYRLDGFAAASAMTFSPNDSAPQYPGAIFSRGHSRRALDHLRSATGRFLDYGNYRYVTGSGKNQSTHNWGFLAFQLDRALPHMVLDSRSNNGLLGGTNLPATFRKEQILSLEGDFDNYFTLYCPQEYERDALYVFTPDLMALLIDTAAPFDVEVIDRWMFVYSAMPFDMVLPVVHRRLLSIVDTVGAKTLTQTDRYVDERIQDFSSNIVAPQGQRLKQRIPLAAIILLGIVLIGFLVFPVIATVATSLP